MPGVIDQLGIRKLLAFGTGVGVEIHAEDLEVALVRVRPNGIRVLGRISIRSFRSRPAAEWGADAVLVGSSLSAAPDPEAAVRALVDVPRAERNHAR